MVHSQTIETYGPQPNNRNIWSSRLADSFVGSSSGLYTTTNIISVRCVSSALLAIQEVRNNTWE